MKVVSTRRPKSLLLVSLLVTLLLLLQVAAIPNQPVHWHDPSAKCYIGIGVCG